MQATITTDYGMGPTSRDVYFTHNFEGTPVTIEGEAPDYYVYAAKEQVFYGPAITSINDSRGENLAGLVGLAVYASELAESNEATYEFDGAGNASMSVAGINGYYYEVWTLSLASRNYAGKDYISSATATVARYYSSSTVTVGGKTVLAPDAVAIETITLSGEQTAGERNYELPFNLESLCYSDWNLTVNYLPYEPSEEIKVSVGIYAPFMISGLDGNETFDPLHYEVLSGPEGGLTIAPGMFGGYDFFGSIKGQYQVKLSTHNVEKTYTVTVEEPFPTEVFFDVYYWDNEWNEYSGEYYTNEFQAEPDVTIYVACTVVPSVVSQEVTFSLFDGDATSVNIGEKTTIQINEWSDPVEAYPVTFTADGTYTFKAASTVDPTVEASLDITVVSPVFGPEGFYMHNDFSWMLDFDHGTLVVRDQFSPMVLAEYTYVTDENQFDPDVYKMDLTLVDASQNWIDWGAAWTTATWDAANDTVTLPWDGTPYVFSKPSMGW